MVVPPRMYVIVPDVPQMLGGFEEGVDIVVDSGVAGLNVEDNR